MIETLSVLNDKNCGCVTLPNNIGANAQEMLTLFREELPYNIVDTISGQCILWDTNFITKVLGAMATGSLANFSDIEKQVWYAFVEYQDAMSHSAPIEYIGAIGCTIPNELGDSYIVTEDGITSSLCLSPESTVAKERQSQSLDEYLMDLYNCITPNDCGIITGTVTDIAPCPI